ncbi:MULTISPECIES: disulfide bond formation protein B [Carnobacterium]|uniref:disulfide bond formation protein B n=1 Tax=Carnobacterium TaxID=2747 RepID=UPI0007F52529|nr:MULTISPECIES: disulfide bond formation protein B [Carnobacterium]MCO6017787.1 disulfide bond formation protein B [Carnobacterium divergens]MDT1938858.1 disulfide bond formation protein B [Carnobacterium divergens]MDT1941296.1 disulfide bond formation protein B [Carnobacterium divergens]MDT1947094.1 disulfide bond formation protein B [Carnobacterium divergens]MDT1949532.1 disulfide bond formation protein B [Carnobacterium divergens]
MIQNLLKKYGSLLGLLANTAVVGAFLLVLWGSLSAQFLLHELPCPLCVLQRYSMLLVCLGPIYILINRERGELDLQKYMIGHGISIISALLGMVFSARQILLHIGPNDTGYGGVFLGYHFYTWSFITFVIVIIYAAIMLLFSDNLMPLNTKPNKIIDFGIKIVLYVFLFTVAVIFLAIVAELGFNFKLPDDPIYYELFR